MFTVCSAPNCTSDENTRINGEPLKFFIFPSDKKLLQEWEKICTETQLKNQNKSGLRRLCQLHFNEDSFASTNTLKPDAIPSSQINKRKLSETQPELNNVMNKIYVRSVAAVNNESNRSSEESSIQSDYSDETKLQPYRLTIEINKIVQRPCPKSRKKNQTNKNTSLTNDSVNALSKEHRTSVKEEKQRNYLCLVCKEAYETTLELHAHLKEHFTCDVCGIEFSSQKSHEKHYEIHLSHNERYPFKCHVCSALFEKKEYIKTHNHIKNMENCDITDKNRIQYCKSCHLTFRDEPTFRKHLNSHVETASILEQELPLAV